MNDPAQQPPMGNPPGGATPPPPPGGGTPPPPPPPPPQQGGGAQPPAGGTPVPPPAQQPPVQQPPVQQPPVQPPAAPAQQNYAPPAPAQPAAPAGPPVRPGDPVPDGGLDPTQVFASPPPPPPQAQGDGSQPPQDSGPPPPPPGQQYTDDQLKQMGYDDEDIRILREVGDYRFGSISSHLTNDRIVAPAHPETQFDDQLFLTLLRGSISLTRDEKWRIIMAIPKLSQFQIDELQKILEEEKRKFSELSPKHLLQLQKLEQKHTEDWKDLQQVTVQQGAKEEEQAQADDIRKQLGL